ncbi:MAG: 50S ribosomal protein L9 [Proteobacteria bacterium]|nr:50S ribosomal protein L9 [Pseudomonadota bacterium]
MEVILLERVEKLGQMGDVVNVKPGYARNYLLPQKMALRATKANLAYFEQQHTHLEAANLERRSEAEAVAGKFEGLSIVLVRQASEMGQLYGSIRPQDIADGVNDAGVTLEHKQVKLDRPIKTIGLHKVRIALHPEVAVEITANVARSEAEAELQAQAAMPVPAPAEAGDDGRDRAAEAPEAEARSEDAGADAKTDAEAETDAEANGDVKEEGAGGAGKAAD